MRAPAPPGRRTRALVVDDEPAILRVVSAYLEQAGFDVAQAEDAASALAAARRDPPDVVVLDLMLPDVDGIEVCRRLRTFSDAYVLMLTARAEEVDTLIGLSVGADDYLTKPFSPRVLLARIQALLRRPRTSPALPGGADGQRQPDQMSAGRTVGDLHLDPASREVTVAGRPVELTRTEFDLLEALSARPRQVLSRRRLLDAVWGPDWFGDERAVDVHISHLRAKLGDQAVSPRYILTVRGVGFRIGLGEDPS